MTADPQHGSAEQAPHEDLPRTGVADIDAAVADLAELRDLPLDEHHDRLARAHAALSEALSGSGTTAAEVPGGAGDPARP